MKSPYYAIRMSRSNATQFTCATQRRNARGYATIDDLYVIAPFAENERRRNGQDQIYLALPLWYQSLNIIADAGHRTGMDH